MALNLEGVPVPANGVYPRCGGTSGTNEEESRQRPTTFQNDWKSQCENWEPNSKRREEVELSSTVPSSSGFGNKNGDSRGQTMCASTDRVPEEDFNGGSRHAGSFGLGFPLLYYAVAEFCRFFCSFFLWSNPARRNLNIWGRCFLF